MDPELLSTVQRGDVENFIKLCDTRSHGFFLAKKNEDNLNMFHILSANGSQALIEEALNRLPIQVVRQLICQTDSYGHTPVHDTADYGFPAIAKLLVDAYCRSSRDGEDLSCPPWREANYWGKLPVDLALDAGHDEVAAFLISADRDVLRCVDAGSLLDKSALSGFKRTAEAILTSGVEYRISDSVDPNRIVELARNCSESNAVLLLQQHQEIIKRLNPFGRGIILHHAVEHNWLEIIKTILNIDISISYTVLGEDGGNLLHMAAGFGRLEIALLLVDAFNMSSCMRPLQRRREAAARSNSTRLFETQEDLLAVVSPLSVHPPWREARKDGITPLHLALFHGHKKVVACLLLSELAFLSDLAGVYENPPIVPVMEQDGFKEVTERFLTPEVRRNFTALYLETFLQVLRENRDYKTKKMIIQHPKLIEYKDASGRTILDYALDEHDADIMCFILETHPSAIDIQDGEQEEHLLIKACRKGKLPAIRAICAIRPQSAALREGQTTALHNVRLRDLREYRSLLDIREIAELKNKTDAQGRTPLIKAIQEDDVSLAEALLEMEHIDLMNIKSRQGKTAADMLRDKSKESMEWENLYKKIKQATSYIPPGTNLTEMRNTLSVVAALLATITFAAAFTIPGGFDQNNGDALLGQKASFIIFILSDTYAMCCSMVVLYSLVWSMAWDSELALALINVSVFLLHQSLYGTLVAFIAGVYTMVSHKSLWVAVVVCVTCSCVPIFANRRILFAVLDKFVQTSRPEGSHPRAETSIDPTTLSDETRIYQRTMSVISITH